jgi:HEXXH motif-containing protein
MYEELPLQDFAGPLPNWEANFPEELVVEHTKQAFARYVEHCSDRRSLAQSGLLTTLASADPENLSFDTVWHPAFGGTCIGFPTVSDTFDRRAAALALRMHESGHPGEWEVSLEQPVHFQFARWSLPAGKVLKVQATPEQIRINVGSNGDSFTVEFERHADGLTPTGKVSELPSVKGELGPWVVWGLNELEIWKLDDIAANVETRDPELMVPRCAAALAILGEYAPAYSLWVNKVVRYVTPWRVRKGERPSGSSSSNVAPGLVGVGNHDHASSFADSLVHEASHHYYYIAKRLGEFDDGTDKSLYFNPFLETKRPIDRILLAYHAFANVRLFCRSAVENGLVDDHYILKREEQLKRHLEILEDALLTSRALTPLGRALWEPLYRQTHD